MASLKGWQGPVSNHFNESTRGKVFDLRPTHIGDRSAPINFCMPMLSEPIQEFLKSGATFNQAMDLIACHKERTYVEARLRNRVVLHKGVPDEPKSTRHCVALGLSR